MVDLLGAFVAAAPFLVAAVGLVGLRWPAVWAGAATLVAAVFAAVVWPGLELGGVLGSLAGGVGTSGRVLYVLFGGLLLYNLLSAGGAVERVSRFLGRLEPDPVALAAGVVVGVAPFFESVTGFGVAVVISAPILLAAGFSPLKAAVLASWGQCAVPWGALGVGTVIGADLARMDFGTLSNASAFLSLPLFPVYGVAAVALAGGWGGVRRRGVQAAGLGLVAGVGTLLTSLYLVPELSGAVGGLAATAVFVARRWSRVAATPVRSLLPYGFLLALLAGVNGIGAVGAAFARLGPVFVGPGLPLLVSGAFAALVLGLGAGEVGRATRRTAAQWLPTAGAVLTFVLAGEVVAGSGAAALLAAQAQAAGRLYGAISPVLAALGGALTGSNAASNALFMPLQVEAARGLGLSEELTAAVQNVAGSHASLLAPQRVVLAATAVGLLGSEGQIVRVAVVPVAVSVAVLAVLAMIP
ncbi:MAG: L-lactate permease [Actinomycetota bacterium]|nr:L-lactate permease [Actinomycetota bacterium]